MKHINEMNKSLVSDSVVFHSKKKRKRKNPIVNYLDIEQIKLTKQIQYLFSSSKNDLLNQNESILVSILCMTFIVAKLAKLSFINANNFNG